ncbi:MAG: hypothetical protein RL205_589 [Actinomycetota bacterium]|jgi:uncharacterized membrane protein YfcA
MTTLQWALIALAGFGGGIINAAVGSGTLLVYPVLTGMGVPPVTANGSNGLGLVTGSITSAWTYRALWRDRWRILRWPILAGCLGALIGAALVIGLDERIFVAVIPWLVLAATALVGVSPLVTRWLRSRRPEAAELPKSLWPYAGAVGIYSGYFGAGQGIVLLALFGIRYDTDIQRANAAKNAFAAAANLVAALVFLVTGHVDIAVAACIALGAIPGGYVGGHWAKRLPDPVLRGLVVLVGIVATVYLFRFR